MRDREIKIAHYYGRQQQLNTYRVTFWIATEDRPFPAWTIEKFITHVHLS